MKKVLLALSLLVLLAGCKKAVEKAKQDALVQVMIDGQWKITNFKLNNVTITDDFEGYSFKYYETLTVDAIKNGVVERTGTWDGDIATHTTWANFPNSPEPISLINGTWIVNHSDWTYVVASFNDGVNTKLMRLDKL